MKRSPRNILVTGGAGYIGSVLTGQLLLAGYRVRVLDNLTYGGGSLLTWANHSDFELVTGDIQSPSIAKKAVAGMDAIVHLAAIVGDPACRAKPELAVAVNKDGSEKLCEEAKKAGVERFIFASTCSNYGKMAAAEGYVDEDSHLRPVSLYAELKVGFEKHLLAQSSPGYTPVCLRFATAFGLSPRPRFDLTVNEFTRDLALGKKLEVYGETFWRPYCHVVDLTRACIIALEVDTSAVSGKAFNVGETTENYRKKDLIELILEEIPEASELVSFVHKDEDPRDYRVTFARIKTELGFAGTKTVPDGIRETIAAIRSGLIIDPQSSLYRNL